MMTIARNIKEKSMNLYNEMTLTGLTGVTGIVSLCKWRRANKCILRKQSM